MRTLLDTGCWGADTVIRGLKNLENDFVVLRTCLSAEERERYRVLG